MAMGTGMAPGRPSGARRWRSSDAWAAGQFWRPPTYGRYQGSGRAAPGPAGRGARRMPMSARTAPTTITLGKYFWGLGASLLALLIGAWLMVAPFALGYQPYGDSWTGATTNDFWLGLAVVVVSLVGLALFAGSLLGD